LTTIDTLKTAELKKQIKFATELMDSVIRLANQQEDRVVNVLTSYGFGDKLFSLIPSSEKAYISYKELFKENSYYFQNVAAKILIFTVDSIAPNHFFSAEAQRYAYVNDDVVYESQILARMRDGFSERVDTFYCYTDELCTSFDFTGQNNSVMLLLHNGNIVLETMNELIDKADKQIKAADAFLGIIADFESKK
jgi:hypothetical protein